VPVHSIREQRMYARVRFYESVRSNPVLRPDQSWYLLAEDLGEGGLMLLSPERFAVDLPLLMDIEPDQVSEPIHCIGRVVWAARADNQEGYRLGIEFLEMSDAARGRLRQLVADRTEPGNNDFPCREWPFDR